MAKLPELQVVIPYKTLTELLSAAEDVPKLKKDLAFRDQQIAALRSQLTEVFETIRDLREEMQRYD